MPDLIMPVGGQTNNPPNPIPKTVELVIGSDKYNVNPTGDAVDVNGKVIKTKAEFEVLKNPAPAPVLTEEQKLTATKLAEKTAAIEAQLIPDTEIEIDEIKYKLNKDGAAVDSSGKIVKTKDELKTLLLAAKDETPDLDYVSEIQKVTNISITSETGQPVVYENTVQGLAQYTQDVHKEGRKLGITEYERELIDKYPILPSILEHLDVHGNLKDFIEDIDYSKVTITDDENQHIDIYTKAKLAQGVSQAEITEMIGYLKADKKLKNAATIGLTYLNTAQTTRSADRANAAIAAKNQADLEKTNYWKEVDSVITSKQLIVDDKKFVIPEVIKVKEADGKVVIKTIKDFQEYIKKPLTFKIDGQVYTMTQLEYDEVIKDTKRTPHHDLYDAYQMFTKYDNSQLIAANSSDNIVKKIIKLSTKVNGGVSGTSGNAGKLILPIK